MKGVKMKKTILLAFTIAMALTAAAQEARTASLVVTNCCESKVDALLLPKLRAVLTTKLSQIGLRTVNPDFFKDKADKTHGKVTVSVWQLQDSKSNVGSSAMDHRYSICMEINLADAQGATVCGGVGVNTNSQSYSAQQIANHGQKYIDALIVAAAEDCARQWKNNPDFCKWIKSPIPQTSTLSPPDPLLRRMYFDSKMNDMSVEIRNLRSEIKGLRDQMTNLLEEVKVKKEKSGELSVSDVDKSVQKLLVENMRKDAKFMQNYDEAMKDMNKLPMVVVGLIKDETKGESGHPSLENLLAAARVDVRVQLFKSSLFDVKDDDARVELAKRIVESDTSPLENPELMDALKKHGSPDFYCAGDLRYFKESKKYRLRIAVHSLRTGKIVWEDTVDIEK